MTLEVGFYWVRFAWGWEPARWDGQDWQRCGIAEAGWHGEFREVGPVLVKPDGFPG